MQGTHHTKHSVAYAEAAADARLLTLRTSLTVEV
jgi:hypothetical protein